ncbi:hypothetical protein Gotur_007251 [Gossypium turneri]
MHARKRLHRGGMTSWRRNGWQFFRIFRKRTSSGELLGASE